MLAAACTPPRHKSKGVTGGFPFYSYRLLSYFWAIRSWGALGYFWMFVRLPPTTHRPLPSHQIISQQFTCAINQSSEFLLFVRKYFTNDLCVNGEALMRRNKKTWKLPQFIHVHTATSHFLVPRCSHTPKCQNMPLLHKKRDTRKRFLSRVNEKKLKNEFSIK